jgi:hypothetical protein
MGITQMVEHLPSKVQTPELTKKPIKYINIVHARMTLI